MTMTNLRDALVQELKDLMSAENQITKALPKLAKNAASDELREAFEHHLEETDRQVERLEKAFEMLEEKPGREKCKGMAGLIEEGEHIMKKQAEDEAMDVMLIAAAQKVEHYEIASYGTVIEWAKSLGLDDIANLLGESLEEEKAADEKLTELAATLNQKALVAAS